MTDVPATLWTALMSATGNQWHLDNRVLPNVAHHPELQEAAAKASQHLGAACAALQSARKLAET
jgi:hypothetical protein